MRVADRGHHPPGHRPGRHPQLGVDAGHHHVEPAEQILRWSSEPSSRMSTSMPVRMRNGASSDSAHRPARAELQPRRDSPLATVSRGEWSSARSTRARGRGPSRPFPVAGCRHRTSRSACGSHRERGPHPPRRRRPVSVSRPSTRASHRALPRSRLRRVADALQRLQRARLYPALELALGQGAKHGGRAAEGLHAVRRRAAPLQLERDLPSAWRGSTSDSYPGPRNFRITGGPACAGPRPQRLPGEDRRDPGEQVAGNRRHACRPDRPPGPGRPPRPPQAGRPRSGHP